MLSPQSFGYDPFHWNLSDHGPGKPHPHTSLNWPGLTIIALQLLRIARYIFHPSIVFLPIIYFNLTLPVKALIPGLSQQAFQWLWFNILKLMSDSFLLDKSVHKRAHAKTFQAYTKMADQCRFSNLNHKKFNNWIVNRVKAIPASESVHFLWSLWKRQCLLLWTRPWAIPPCFTVKSCKTKFNKSFNKILLFSLSTQEKNKTKKTKNRIKPQKQIGLESWEFWGKFLL